ncbi:invasion plasmid antigen [Shigella flexneri]|nr:invasion plasmid antigen [Shigella flexneri]
MRETEQQIYRQLTDEVLALRLSENGSQLQNRGPPPGLPGFIRFPVQPDSTPRRPDDRLRFGKQSGLL